MVGKQGTDNLVISGPKGRIEYAVRANGIAEAKAWIDCQQDKVRAQFNALFYMLVNRGVIANKKQFRKLRGMDDVWEFKRGPSRLFCVNDGSRWLLTHPYTKGHSKGHQTDAGKHAIAIAREHCERERNASKGTK